MVIKKIECYYLHLLLLVIRREKMFIFLSVINSFIHSKNAQGALIKDTKKCVQRRFYYRHLYANQSKTFQNTNISSYSITISLDTIGKRD